MSAERGGNHDDDAELRALVDAYAACADAGDSTGFGDLFLPHARLTTWPADGAPGLPREGREAIAAIPATLAHRYERTTHLVGEQHLVVASEGRTALGTVECEAHHVTGGVDRVLRIRYDDSYRRDDEGRWRFATRDVHVLQVTEQPA